MPDGKIFRFCLLLSGLPGLLPGTAWPAKAEMELPKPVPIHSIYISAKDTLYVYTGRDASFYGACCIIPMTYKESTDTLNIGKREGSFPGMLEEKEFRVFWVTRDKPAALRQDPAAPVTVYANDFIIITNDSST